ncbi:DGQHR domain-containing protein [Chimaeribacter californicus]|uniref:DGQHR domain-containing protein n=1 Tax=Chimaeribacter californicus TaxID=2060067 RepID=A0A2N5EF89_9GAMM|nr:DGQHR domain-containing protein [Chimaeribacter californicus]PLR41166.1 DGQHR domain-containing protein [Chimaeribacter californicus]
MNNYPLRLPALKIIQPLGEFYVASISAETLLEVSYTIKAEILDDEDEASSGYLGGVINKLVGNQRKRTPKRLEEIRAYTETIDASFPNSIILGVNYHEDGGLETNPEERWYIEKVGNDFYNIVIPSSKKLASIIDGQHRVFGFENSKAKSMELLCSVYLDLPLAYHARIFTNININQKRVDKNLAYNLFQFDIEQGEPETWSPETLAVYFARVLEKDADSPFKGKIKLGVENSSSSTSISMASIIDGILSLITNNPKSDRELLHTKKIGDGRNRTMLSRVKSNAPLRELYIKSQDKTIFNIINDFFLIINKYLGRYKVFNKTLGVHATFDFLKIILNKNIKFTPSMAILCSKVNFNDSFFGVQTKLRVRLKNTLLLASGVIDIVDLEVKDPNELQEYIRILK